MPDEPKYLPRIDAKSTSPFVGMGVTQCFLSDRYSYSVVEVLGPKRLVVRSDYSILDKFKSSSVQGGHKEYNFLPSPNGKMVVITKRKNGRWYAEREPIGSTFYLLGQRNEYYDPSF